MFEFWIVELPTSLSFLHFRALREKDVPWSVQKIAKMGAFAFMTGICRNVSLFRKHFEGQFSFLSKTQKHMECRCQDDSADPLGCVCWSRGWSFPAEVTPLTRLGFRVSLFHCCVWLFYRIQTFKTSAWKLQLKSSDSGLRGLLIICSFFYMELCLVLSSVILSCSFNLVFNNSANWMEMWKVCCFPKVKPCWFWMRTWPLV